MKAGTYRHYMLIVLMVIMAFTYVERLALGLLLQDIKTELALSDTQLGLLTGIAFAFFYALMGIPIARWADRGDRVLIITLSAILCSVAVALCGLAGGFVQLLIVRVAVGVGEAGCIPAAHSLMADYFSRAERPKAVGIYKLGLPLSSIVGFLLAGWLNELYGWRVTFMLLGLPGLALAGLAWFTLREPRRGKPDIERQSSLSARNGISEASPAFLEVMQTLWANRTFRHLLIGYAITYFFGVGIGQWNATFFIRSFEFKTGALGTWLAVITGVSGLVGISLGGRLAFRYATNNERLQLKAIAATSIVSSGILIGKYLSPSPYLAFALMGLAHVVASVAVAPLFATLQTLVPERMRAMSIALVFLFANLIGLGLGPLAAGAISDAFHSWAGAESLRYASLVLCPGYAWAGWHFWRASRTVMADLKTANPDEVAAALHP